MSKNEVEKQLVFEKLDGALADIISSAGHSELWGYDLSTVDTPVRECLLRKFLQANNYEFDKAKNQLSKTLKWRKTFRPLSAAFSEQHAKKFDVLGIVTDSSKDSRVVTWNLYGVVKNREELFGDLDAFIRWRVGLMEQGLSKLDFSKSESAYMDQVHDYEGVSILKLDTSTRAATQKAIAIFQDYYPEVLYKKYFLNVPWIMSWMFTLVKPLVSKETLAKFEVMSDGSKLSSKMGDWVPKVYGGKAESLDAIKVTSFKPVNESLLQKEQATPEKGQAKAEDKSEGKPEDKAEENSEDKAVDEAEEKPLDKAEEKAEDKSVDKPVDNPAEKPEEKTEDKPAEPAKE